MASFTPLAGIIGGSLIGGSAGVLLLMNGDIMGISGILSNTLLNPFQSRKDPKNHWRYVFLGSFGIAVNIYVHYLTPDIAFEDTRSQDTDVPIPSLIGHILGGFFVGMGTRIGNGCTTGHGICGLGRFSPRSFAAVLAFTGCSILTRFLTSPTRSWSAITDILHRSTPSAVSPLASAIVMGVLALPAMMIPAAAVDDDETNKKDGNTSKGRSISAVDASKSLGAAISGIMFAAGLAISGMTKNSKVHDFLCFSNLFQNKFDPTLVAVLGSGIGISVLSYEFVKGYGSSALVKNKLDCPMNLPKESKFGIPTNKTIDVRLITGASIFGIGWGLTGICPGPGLYAAAAGVIDAIVGWMPGFLIGSYVGKEIISNVFEGKTHVQQTNKTKTDDPSATSKKSQ